MNGSDRINELFEKYLGKECTPEEVRELIKLLQKAEAELVLDERMKMIWDTLRDNERHFDIDWKKMYKAIVNSQQQTEHLIKTATRKNRLFLKSTAAALLIIISVAVGFYFLGNRKEQQDYDLVQQTVAGKPGQPQVKRQVIHLPDGSTVTLNAAARLNYPPVFSDKSRDVYLEGEAFFDVRHIEGRPFYVHAGQITVKVLGTAFNIKAIPAGKTVEVTVTRGKVQVLSDTAALGVLTASQQMSVPDGKIKDAVIKIVDTQNVMSWKPAEFFLNDVTLKEVALSIEEWYGMKMRFVNERLADCRVTATFSEDDTVQEMMEVLCGVTRATYTITNNLITIDGKGCD
ncbi:MAG: FecR domain-containing protein [Chitinophagaceae bacterium]|nr:FecR domain-containing protein [Chitinophagaceae bacterium]